MSQYGDGEYAEVWRVATRVARKEHQCAACWEPIRRGHKYTDTFGVYDGNRFGYKRCERCQVIYTHLSGRIDAEGEPDEFCDEELNCGHDYEERWNEPPPEWLAELAFWRPGDPLPGPKR